MSYRIDITPYHQAPGSDDCGPGALKMVLSAFGKDVSIEELRSLTGVVQGAEWYSLDAGTEHEGMIAAAKALGFFVFTKSGERKIEDLTYFIEQEHLPVIIGWFDVDNDHYSVVTGLTDTELIIADPASGAPDERRIARETFLGVWFDFIGKESDRVCWGWFMVLSPDKRAFEVEGGTYDAP